MGIFCSWRDWYIKKALNIQIQLSQHLGVQIPQHEIHSGEFKYNFTKIFLTKADVFDDFFFHSS